MTTGTPREPEGTQLAAQLGDVMGGPEVPADPETETVDLRRKLWNVQRLGESLAESGNLTIRRCGEQVLGMAGDRGRDGPRVTVDLNVRVRKHETYSGFEDVAGANPSSLRFGDRILAVETESGIFTEAVVTAVDAEKRLVYLVPDWHGWRDLESGGDKGVVR